MNFVSKYPTAMKSFIQPNFYFSAYPLKAISKEVEEKKSYLHIITKRNGKVKYSENLKVLPMVNPYDKKEETRLSNLVNKHSHQDKIEDRDADWFASYE